MSKSINTAVSRTRFNLLALEGSWIIFRQVITILGSLALVGVLMTEHLANDLPSDCFGLNILIGNSLSLRKSEVLSIQLKSKTFKQKIILS